MLLLGALAANVAAAGRTVPLDAPLGATAHVAVGSPTAFRLSLSLTPAAPTTPMPSPMLAPAEPPEAAVPCEFDGLRGLCATFGSLGVSPAGRWALRDADNNTITGSDTLLSPSSAAGTVTVELGRRAGELLYGTGGGAASSMAENKTDPIVINREWWAPHYWSSAGYATLVVGSHSNAPDWTHKAGGLPAFPANCTADEHTIRWQVLGRAVDLYLMPASSMIAGMDVYTQLIGRPKLAPRYALGFIASRWGWTDKQYIDDVLTFFRNGSFPLDAIHIDFEWYTAQLDYGFPPTGKPNFRDFDWNSKLFPGNATDHKSQLTHYHEDKHIKFGGIRKPRLGNTALLQMARERGWLLHNTEQYYAGRGLNFSKPDLREWYSQQTRKFLEAGVDFYLDDEGENTFFEFYYWNLAQREGLDAFDKTRRLFTISRAWTPGMQRLGATSVWTGDVPVSWQAIRNTPTYMLDWSLAGSSYVLCDAGGFNGGQAPPALLVRWYQTAALMPIMFTHSAHQLPHFPYLYGVEAGDAMRAALDLRYSLLPMLYSLAHEQTERGTPITRPMAMHFADPSLATLDTQWLLGSSLLVAPCLTGENETSHNTSDVYFPADSSWYMFGRNGKDAPVQAGPKVLHLTNVPLDAIPMYVAGGSIVVLAPRGLQYSDMLPGGPLQVHIYAGGDAAFTLYEDDGASLAYEQNAVRQTTFRWSEKDRELSWAVDGGWKDEHVFLQMQAVLFDPHATVRSGVVPLGTGGHHAF